MKKKEMKKLKIEMKFENIEKYPEKMQKDFEMAYLYKIFERYRRIRIIMCGVGIGLLVGITLKVIFIASSLGFIVSIICLCLRSTETWVGIAGNEVEVLETKKRGKLNIINEKYKIIPLKEKKKMNKLQDKIWRGYVDWSSRSIVYSAYEEAEQERWQRQH